MSKEEEKIIIEADEEGFSREPKKGKNALRVLVFSLSGEGYCMEIGQAKEVIRLPEVTRVPSTPEFVAGIMNLRGEIIALISLHYFFGLAPEAKAEGSRVIVTDAGGSVVGILVDRVEDAIDVEEGLIQAPLATLNERVASFTRGQVRLEDRILTLLDMKKVLNNDEIKALKKGGR